MKNELPSLSEFFERAPVFLTVFLLIISILGCERSAQTTDIFLSQGIMIGEVTAHSAIIQTRLCSSDTLISGDLPGATGWIRFMWSTEEDLSLNIRKTLWQPTNPANDYIIKAKIPDLPNDTYIYYQAEFGGDTFQYKKSGKGKFRTLPGSEKANSLSFVVVTGMNYYFHFYGHYNASSRYQGADQDLGYPALANIQKLQPDYFIGTGDNVYFDHPAEKNYTRAFDRGDNPLPGIFNGKEVIDENGMRQKYHLQFSQPRFRQLFQSLATYWEKDDHDYRVNDSDPFTEFPISHELGIKNFREQLPVVDSHNQDAETYRTIRFTKDLQIWFLEGRDYRSANGAPDGPEKSIWGEKQKQWLKETLLESDAHFKCIISPTPMVGPDDASKKDNHVNPEGFRYEGDAFFRWLVEQKFSQNRLFIICGDRHWQYHAEHPSGYQEFSTGALVDANSRAGRVAGDIKSTDPEGKIKQYYVQGTPEQATGGFLHINQFYLNDVPRLKFTFYDDLGSELYVAEK